MKCMPQKQFHLSPNEAFTDTVGKLWCNKLLPANIKEICSLIAKQVNPSMTVFHDQVRGEHSSQSLMQQEGSSDKLWLAGEITYGSFRMKMLFPGGMKNCVLLDTTLFPPAVPLHAFSQEFTETRHFSMSFCSSVTYKTCQQRHKFRQKIQLQSSGFFWKLSFLFKDTFKHNWVFTKTDKIFVYTRLFSKNYPFT